jgi:hypothetical protein
MRRIKLVRDGAYATIWECLCWPVLIGRTGDILSQKESQLHYYKLWRKWSLKYHTSYFSNKMCGATVLLIYYVLEPWSLALLFVILIMYWRQILILVKFVKRQANMVANSLARAAVLWFSSNIIELLPHCSFKKKKASCSLKKKAYVELYYY